MVLGAMTTSDILFVIISFLTCAQSQISSSSELDCDFNTFCRWRNSTTGGEDDGDFWLTDDVQIDHFHHIRPLRNGTGNRFAFTRGPFDGYQKAILISDVISCQLGGSSLRFWYYRTGRMAKLDVCIRQPPGAADPASLKCFPAFAGNHGLQWVFTAIEFPPITQHFELMFRAIYIQPLHILAIDDITFHASLCENTNVGSTEGAGGRFDGSGEFFNASGKSDWKVFTDSRSSFLYDGNPIPLPILDNLTERHQQWRLHEVAKGASTHLNRASSRRFLVAGSDPSRMGAQYMSKCAYIDCTFDEGDLCEYISAHAEDDVDLILGLPAGTKIMQWIVSGGRVANSLTGIATDYGGRGSFIYAGETDDANVMFVLSTPRSVTVDERSVLDFFMYMAGTHGRMRVCIDHIRKCPFEKSGTHVRADSRKWINYQVGIQKGPHMIYFVADRLKKNYVIGLDQIQLLNKFGTSAMRCRV